MVRKTRWELSPKEETAMNEKGFVPFRTIIIPEFVLYKDCQKSRF